MSDRRPRRRLRNAPAFVLDYDGTDVGYDRLKSGSWTLETYILTVEGEVP